jgi:NTP pyrophosphatase (non-canonical NTP hydrolase)
MKHCPDAPLHETWRHLLSEYHATLHPEHLGYGPLTMPAEVMSFRKRLFAEEAREALDEFDQCHPMAGGPDTGTVTHLVHELADTVFVAYGTAELLGIDLDAVLLAVAEANAQKRRNPDPDGKAIKPPDFVPATEAIRLIVEQAIEVSK